MISPYSPGEHPSACSATVQDGQKAAVVLCCVQAGQRVPLAGDVLGVLCVPDLTEHEEQCVINLSTSAWCSA